MFRHQRFFNVIFHQWCTSCMMFLFHLIYLWLMTFLHPYHMFAGWLSSAVLRFTIVTTLLPCVTLSWHPPGVGRRVARVRCVAYLPIAAGNHTSRYVYNELRWYCFIFLSSSWRPVVVPSNVTRRHVVSLGNNSPKPQVWCHQHVQEVTSGPGTPHSNVVHRGRRVFYLGGHLSQIDEVPGKKGVSTLKEYVNYGWIQRERGRVSRVTTAS